MATYDFMKICLFKVGVRPTRGVKHIILLEINICLFVHKRQVSAQQSVHIGQVLLHIKLVFIILKVLILINEYGCCGRRLTTSF